MAARLYFRDAKPFYDHRGKPAMRRTAARRFFVALLASALTSALLAAATPATPASAAEAPQKYDLRDPDGDGDRSDSVVTPVKQQDPWNTCWAFGSAAAAETSILSKMGATAADTRLDLSERGVALASYTPVGASISASQAGEGYVDGANAGLDAGGKPYYAIVSFSAGLGPTTESALPYRNNEGLITCSVLDQAAGHAQTVNLTQAQIAALGEKATVTPLYYAGKADGSDGATWAADPSLWARSGYELIDGNVLPGLRSTDEAGRTTLSGQGMDAVKQEILSGRAVTVSYEHDENRYLNKETWSYCCYESSGGSHVACIVGWDDTYDASNFKAGENGERPAGNGAWLVKNSFGAQTEDFPNQGDWGIEENGRNTGYFWLSYYDMSAGDLVSFDFDLTRSNADAGLYIDQYDFLPNDTFEASPCEGPTSSANVYTAQADMLLRAIGTTVYQGDTTVTYQIYLLDKDAASPTQPGHSTLAYTATRTYVYAGYHRLELDEADRVAMRDGQRYAVVTTQRGADGTYYQAASTAYKVSRLRAKVNAGESWTGTTSGNEADGTSITWTDWRETLDDPDGEGFASQVDNFSIKGISCARDWASVDELAALEQAASGAAATLAAAKTSDDGLDVTSSETWLTPEERAALESAVQDARAALTAAGADYSNALANTTPTSSEAARLTASLSVSGKAGLQGAGEAKSYGDGKKDQPAAVQGGRENTPQTGDPAMPLGPFALTGAVALLLGGVSRRRQGR